MDQTLRQILSEFVQYSMEIDRLRLRITELELLHFGMSPVVVGNGQLLRPAYQQLEADVNGWKLEAQRLQAELDNVRLVGAG